MSRISAGVVDVEQARGKGEDSDETHPCATCRDTVRELKKTALLLAEAAITLFQVISVFVDTGW